MPTTSWIRNLTIALAIWCGTGVAGTWLGAALGGGTPQVAQPFEARTFLTAEEPPPNRAHQSFGIFARNFAVYALLLAGMVSGGLTTVFTLAFNGFLMGNMFGVASTVDIPIKAGVWLLAPHGVLELPLLFLAGAIGLQGPAAALAWIRGNAPPWQSRRILFTALTGIPLLAVAAAIEGYLTIPIARAVLLP